MGRIKLDDGRFFDTNEAEEFTEKTRWDGSNNVSVNVGKFDSQTLYKTRKGTWVLETTSRWVGRPTRYQIIDQDAADRWLMRNGHDDAVSDTEALEV